MVTIDPERDTEAKLKEYLAFFDPDFIGLRGDEAQTEQFKRDYGITVKRVEYPDSATKYLLDHSALVYVIDPEGKLLLTFPYGTDPALIAQDVEHILEA
jgi:protein SCO1/2